MREHRKVLQAAVVALGTWFIAAESRADEPRTVHWPSFRGSGAAGVAEGFPTAATWDVAKGDRILWKTAIPGLAHSSPVVWGERVFVTSAVSGDPNPYLRVGLYGESPEHKEDVEHDFKVFCLDKKTGKILWEQTAHRGVPKVKRHIKSTHANSTPATDGKHVVVFFGSEGLYCYDVDGKLKWKKDLGTFDAGAFDAPAGEIQWGFASSPYIHENTVLVQCDAKNTAFIAAFDLHEGNELWRRPRTDHPTWSTPNVVEHAGRKQIVVNGYKHIGGYDFRTGEEIWRLTGGGDVPVPTPVFSDELIFITNAHGGNSPIYAIRPSASGDISLQEGQTSNDHIAWAQMKTGNYMQTPLVYRGLLYACRDYGIVSCLDARTGAKKYRERLANGVGFTSSPVAADGKVYFTSEEGDVYVVKAGPEFELLGKNTLGEICMSTPAVSEGTLFFRTKGHLIAVK